MQTDFPIQFDPVFLLLFPLPPQGESIPISRFPSQKWLLPPRPGGRLPGPWRGRGPFRARGKAGGAGVVPRGRGVAAGFRVPASAPHTAAPLTLGKRQEIVSEVEWWG